MKTGSNQEGIFIEAGTPFAEAWKRKYNAQSETATYFSSTQANDRALQFQERSRGEWTQEDEHLYLNEKPRSAAVTQYTVSKTHADFDSAEQDINGMCRLASCAHSGSDRFDYWHDRMKQRGYTDEDLSQFVKRSKEEYEREEAEEKAKLERGDYGAVYD